MWVLAAAGMAAARGPAAAGEARPFRAEDVVEMARARAAEAFQPTPEAPEAWLKLGFDAYRDIRYRADRAIWRGEDSRFEAQLLPPGYGFRRPVEIAVVENGSARVIPFERDRFTFGPLTPDLPDPGARGYSGFRLHTPINRPDYADEFVVFHGATYFRAVARGQVYGLSARGLAVDTIRPGREEFPDFQKFWLVRPEPGADHLRVHALLDSRSVAGAYSFDIMPGDETRIEVEATLFPRRDIDEAGLAPLTSMFYFNGMNDRRFDDYRPAAHDSDGLLMETGRGDRLWRPLMNHPKFEVSAFADENPRGFGLMQRARRWEDYADLALDYHLRPSLWIRPKGEWGAGHVILVEIPVDREDVDNIVAYWRPKEPLRKGGEHRIAYSMEWANAAPDGRALGHVVATRTGPHREGGRLFVIDFDMTRLRAKDVEADVWASSGEIFYPVVENNPYTGGVRLFFGLRPGEANSVELGASLRQHGQPATETWLYRWTAE